MENTGDQQTITMSEIMPPERANFKCNIHGGYLFLLLDRVAYACAARYCGSSVVTLSVDIVIFKQPIYVGELVTFHANVNYVGRTSLEIGVKVIAENLMTGEIRHTNSCYLTMVAVDENGKPQAVKPLACKTPEQKRRFEEGKLRREMSEFFQDEHQKRKAHLRKKLG